MQKLSIWQASKMHHHIPSNEMDCGPTNRTGEELDKPSCQPDSVTSLLSAVYSHARTLGVKSPSVRRLIFLRFATLGILSPQDEPNSSMHPSAEHLLSGQSHATIHWTCQTNPSIGVFGICNTSPSAMCGCCAGSFANCASSCCKNTGFRLGMCSIGVTMNMVSAWHQTDRGSV